MTRATTMEQMEHLLALLREVDLSTLLALDRAVHRLVVQKAQEAVQRPTEASIVEAFGRQYPHLTIDPTLFTLVGVQPPNPVEEDKALLRTSIVERFAE